LSWVEIGQFFTWCSLPKNIARSSTKHTCSSTNISTYNLGRSLEIQTYSNRTHFCYPQEKEDLFKSALYVFNCKITLAKPWLDYFKQKLIAFYKNTLCSSAKFSFFKLVAFQVLNVRRLDGCDISVVRLDHHDEEDVEAHS
jgi:hypothetical protein